MAFLFAVLVAVVPFLFPIGVYCFFLASINQRSRPLIVNGRWDTVGLLFALCGFFLVTVPSLGTQLFHRVFGILLSEQLFEVWWLLWLAYFLMLVGGGILMMMWRAHKTLIYNVDTAIFPKVLERALATLGLSAALHDERMTLRPVRPESIASTEITATPVLSPAPDDRRHAELMVETFPAMCHVTLHWDSYMPEVRRSLEKELEKELVLATPEENQAAGWFLWVCGMIFGALTLVAMAVIFLMFFGRSGR